jgi:hypothetical protein
LLTYFSYSCLPGFVVLVDLAGLRREHSLVPGRGGPEMLWMPAVLWPFNRVKWRANGSAKRRSEIESEHFQGSGVEA